MQILRQLAASGSALAVVMGLSLCVVGCDKKNDDADEETDEDDDDDDDDDKSKDEGSGDTPATADPGAADTGAVDPGTPTPTTKTSPPKVIVDAGTPPPKDAGAPAKDGGATTSKPGGAACLQKCASLMAQCTATQAKDGGPFALPDLAKCQAAADQCRKACGH